MRCSGARLRKFQRRRPSRRIKTKRAATYSWSGYARTFFYNDVKEYLGILLYTQTLPSGNEPGAAFRAKVAEIVTAQSAASQRRKY
jgi:hypothetical protein